MTARQDTDSLPDPDEEGRRIKRVLASHVAQLMEHVDSVQIIVTKFDPADDCTGMGSDGGGNWYARKASVSEWLTKADEETRQDVRGE